MTASPATPNNPAPKASLPAVLASVKDDLDQVRSAFIEIVSDVSKETDEMVRSAAAFSGKRLRPALTCLAARVAGHGVTEDVATVAAVVELIHTATLVHDDILDSANVRRDQATLNAKWGEQAAVLVGDVLFSKAYRTASYLDDRFASRHLADAVGEVLEGEILQDVLAMDTTDGGSPTAGMDAAEAQYRRIIRGKTAALYDAAMHVGAHYGGGDESLKLALGRYGHHLGMAFQIVDDRLDLDGDEAEVGKSLGRDLSEGKFTLPMIHWVRALSGEERKSAIAFLDLARTDDSAASTLVGALRRTGAFEKTEADARRECEQALQALAELKDPKDPLAMDCLREIAEFVLNRSY